MRLIKKLKAYLYINNYIIFSQKLEQRGEGCTLKTKYSHFLSHIEDYEYNILNQKLTEDAAIYFYGCIIFIRAQERELIFKDKEVLEKAR